MENYSVHGNGTVKVGKRASFGEGVKFIFKHPGEITIGDYVTIGDNVKIIVEEGAVTIDDWCTLHAGTLVLCKQGVVIGQHCWFGQNSILDGTGGLQIDNGVRVGMYSQIWSHIAAGEQIEGCTFFSANPVHICADVWLVGSCTVGSGVTIGTRAVCLSGSNITRSIPAHTVAAGIPAKVKEGIGAYNDISLDQKFSLMRTWIDEFCQEPGNSSRLVDDESGRLCIHSSEGDTLDVFQYTHDYVEQQLDRTHPKSAFCIENKVYSKTFTILEERLMRYLCGNKARFYREMV